MIYHCDRCGQDIMGYAYEREWESVSTWGVKRAPADRPRNRPSPEEAPMSQSVWIVERWLPGNGIWIPESFTAHAHKENAENALDEKCFREGFGRVSEYRRVDPEEGKENP